VVEGGEELSDIKDKNAHVALFEPSYPDKISEVYAYICCRLLVNTPKLMRVKEVISWQVKLKSIANSFFDEFAHGIK